MKRLGKIFITLILSFSISVITSCSSARKTGSMGIELHFKRYELKNGLKVLISEDHTLPVVAYQTWFKVGSVDEDLGATGLAHLFEHLMFKGTDKYGPKQIFYLLQTKGAEVNAFTSRDYTVYHQTFTPDLLDMVIDIESDRLANIRFDQRDLDSERNVVFEERRLRYDNSPAGKMQEALWQLAFQVHSYGWPVIGSMQDLAQLTLNDLNEFFNKFYVPSNATVIIVGDVNAAEVIRKIRNFYEKIPDRPRPKRFPPLEKPQTSERQLVIYDQVASESLMLGYKIVSAYHEDTYALDVLANILFHGKSSLAYQRLVEKEELMSSVNGYAFTPTFDGLFLISGDMRPKHSAQDGVTALDRLIENAVKEGFTEDQVTSAVKQLQVQILDSLTTYKGMAEMIGTVETVIGRAERYGQEVEKYKSVTAEQVKAVAEKYLSPSQRSVVVMKPEASRR